MMNFGGRKFISFQISSANEQFKLNFVRVIRKYGYCARKFQTNFSMLFSLLISGSQPFLPLLILEVFIPPLWNFSSYPIRVRRLVLITIGTMVFIDDNILINKREQKPFAFN